MAFQKMRKNIFLATFMAFGLMFVAACNQDKCKDKDCGNGDCSDIDGTCICATGFDTDANGSCTVPSRNKVVGTYSVAEVAGGQAQAAYDVSISSVTTNSQINEIGILNFFDTYKTKNVQAFVSGNSIDIPSQIPNNDGISVRGSGTYSTNGSGKAVLTMTYVITDSQGPINCTATFTAK